MPRRARLGAALAIAVALGCGPAERSPDVPGVSDGPAGRPREGSPAAPSVSGAPADPPSVAPPSTSAPNAARPSPAPLPMRPIAASAMASELRELGVDPQSLPPLRELPPDKLRNVMKTFTRALGVRCSHCHDTKDYRAPTPNKKVATRMWNDYARALTLDGAALYCDSCHGGRARILDRTDHEALGQYMDENYVAPLRRVDGKEQGCESCHGEPFEGKILTKLWR